MTELLIFGGKLFIIIHFYVCVIDRDGSSPAMTTISCMLLHVIKMAQYGIMEASFPIVMGESSCPQDKRLHLFTEM